MSDIIMEQKIEYHNIPKGYTMKVRIYPNREARENIDKCLMALEKAANITLYELKQHNPEITSVDNKDPAVVWPDFKRMAKADWINRLREQNPAISILPSVPLSSSVGGLFLSDMAKTWEKQGKLPVDVWFDRRNSKGKKVLRYYGGKKKKRSLFLQVYAKNFTIDEAGRIYVRPLKMLGVMRVRGWNDSISFGKDKVSFFEYYKNDPMRALSCRIVKQTIGEGKDEYYMTIDLRDVNRRFKMSEERDANGIDMSFSDATLMTSCHCRYENKNFKAQAQKRIAELHRSMSRRYGGCNEMYRLECARIRETNQGLDYKDRKPFPASSGRYRKAEAELRKLELKVRRQREYYQHTISAAEIARSSMIGIGSMDLKSMLEDKSISYSVSDAAMFRQLLMFKYKGAWSNTPVIEIDQIYRYPPICPECGHRFEESDIPDLETSRRKCPGCGSVLGGNKTVAETIRQEAVRIYEDPDNKVKDPAKVKNKRRWVDKVLDINHPDILIHYDEDMRREYNNPYIIMDSKGNVIDDAQGYGYKSVQKAIKAYKYKYMY